MKFRGWGPVGSPRGSGSCLTLGSGRGLGCGRCCRRRASRRRTVEPEAPLVKPVILGLRFGRGPEMPLPEVGGSVSLGFEEIPHCVVVGADLVMTARHRDQRQPRSDRVTPGQQGRARWRTRGLDQKLVHPSPRRPSLDVRCRHPALRPAGTKTADVSIAEVVGEEEDDIRSLRHRASFVRWDSPGLQVQRQPG